MIFLPGTGQQVEFFLSAAAVKDKKVIIMGPGTLEIAHKMSLLEPSGIIIIVEDYDSLITMRYRLEKSVEKNIEVRMMNFDNTDFRNYSIDVVYAQASVSTSGRNRIVKEIGKILKTGGTFCAGEIVKLKENPPSFMKDIWHSSDLLPLSVEELNRYYTEKGFEISDIKDMSFTLDEFYRQGKDLLSKGINDFSDEEKSYYKKLLKKISHESNAYLELGGNGFMGFTTLIMRKI
jgi:SAM-dependent methyltransferase